MERLTQRFEQDGGNLYNLDLSMSDSNLEGGGTKKISPRSENWKKKYLEIKLERDNLLKENKKLKQQKKELQSKSKS